MILRVVFIKYTILKSCMRTLGKVTELVNKARYNKNIAVNLYKFNESFILEYIIK